jgi:uncharacterized protein YigE (DUF2233 family)
MIKKLLLISLLLFVGFVISVTQINTAIENLTDRAEQFTVLRVDAQQEHIELFLHDEAGQTFKRFQLLDTWLKKDGRQLRFAMNAGMFHTDFSPVGLLIVNGQPLAPLNLADAAGNFFLKPNGVFFVSSTAVGVVESSEYPAMAQGVRFATQSGPLLVRKGAIHPAFQVNATSRLIRNGVGVSGNTVFFVISEKPVNFYEFAAFFRDELHCPDALYLDGVVSGLYAAELNRKDANYDLGAMVGVVK